MRHLCMAGAAWAALYSPAYGEQKSNAEAALLKWYRDNLVGSYNKVGLTNPQADREARIALEAVARHLARDPKRAGNEERVVVWRAEQACKAGCDDPLVLHFYADYLRRAYRDLRLGTSGLLLDHAARRLASTKHSPYWRCSALTCWSRRLAGSIHKSEEISVNRELLSRASRLADEALTLLPSVLADKDAPTEVLLTLCRDLTAAYMALEVPLNDGRHERRKPGYEKVRAVVEEARGQDSPLALVFKGDYLIDAAWDARSNTWAKHVTEERWKLFRERLEQAETALQKAHEAEPTGPAALRMLTVCLSQERKSQSKEVRHARCETWYRRALEAGVNVEAVHEARRYYLEPKWYGDKETQLAFGRSLLKEGKWETRAPLVLVQAHVSLSRYPTRKRKEYARTADADWFKSEENWEDIRAVCEGHLERYPFDIRIRSRYAFLAALAEKWDVAKVHFDKLGDHPDLGEFPSRAEYERLRKESALRSANPSRSKP